MNKVMITFFLFLITGACKKPEERACFKTSGPIIKKVIYPGEFSKIYLKEHLDYVMVQDTLNYIVLEAGKNLMDFVDCSILENELIISNNNKCKFFRYKKGQINAEIHFKSADRIIFQGTGILSNRANWKFNTIDIVLKDAGGSMQLTNFIGNSLNLINSHGWGDITLSGEVNYFLADMAGNGYFDSRNFNVRDSISVITNSSTISKLNTTGCKLKAQLKASGDLWYYGLPTQIWKEEIGSGKLIDKN